MENENDRFEQLRFEVDGFFRELPKIKIGQKQYYRDDKLREFRYVNNPNERLTFEEYAIIEIAQKVLSRLSN